MAESTVASVPKVEKDDAQAFVTEHWGDGWILDNRDLPSERDRNFKFTRGDGSGSLVVKIFNPAEELAFIECQHAAAEHVASRWPEEPFLCQVPQPSLSGTKIVELHQPTQKLFARAFPFIPGKVIAEVDQTEAVLCAAGAAVGKVTAALLMGFDHAAAHRSFLWDLSSCHEVFKHHLSKIQEPDRLEIAQGMIRQFDDLCGPVLQSLRRSIVHNDGNDYNLIVRLEGSSPDEQSCQVSVLDFGDMVHTYTVSDAAIALAYLLFEKKDPVEDTLPFVKSYHSVCPLEPSEVDCLFPLAIMRVCTSLCISAYQRTLRPDDEYLSISAAPGWRLLEQLRAVSFAQVQKRYREALGLVR